MSISPKHEMIVFWGAFASALIIGIILDFCRVLRWRVKKRPILLGAIDAIFCFLAFKIFFDICYITNNGGLRWYIFAAFILGCIIYLGTVSRFIRKIFLMVFKALDFFLRPLRLFLVYINGKVISLFKMTERYFNTLKLSFKAKFRQIATKKDVISPEKDELI